MQADVDNFPCFTYSVMDWERCSSSEVFNRVMLNKLWLYALPKQTLTQLVGRFARSRHSRYLIPWYIRFYKIDCSSAEFLPEKYPSLVAFFSRRLRPEMRPVTHHGIASPVDGHISEFGKIISGRLLQAKGCDYSLASLIGSEEEAATFLGGDYITIYLSPRDYHRIHMPLDGTVVGWRHVPGSLFPVNRAGVRHISGLFTRNERLISQVHAETGEFLVVKVGATIVGSIKTPYGPKLPAARQRKRLRVTERELSVSMRRGDEMGRFEFGSTVILIFQKGMVESFSVTQGEFVQMGEQIAISNSL